MTAVAGGWLGAATAVGPWRDPLPTVLVVATFAFGVPWWTHRRRRVRVDRTIQAWPEIAEAIGLAGSRVLSADADHAVALTGNPVPTAWGPALAVAMSARGLAVHEEFVLPDILADLRERHPDT